MACTAMRLYMRAPLTRKLSNLISSQVVVVAGEPSIHPAARYSQEPSPFRQPGSLFSRCWSKLEAEAGSGIVIPREIIFLNGPPGSGKGANLEYVKRVRGLTKAITMSSMLAPFEEAQAIIAEGGLVPDDIVGQALLAQAFHADKTDAAGVIVDGFPRSPSQVEFIEDLHAHLAAKHAAAAESPELTLQFPQTAFKMVVLYVDAATSVSRQMARQAASVEHNKKVREARAGTILEERTTDKSVSKCRERYHVFRRHYPALTRLQRIMPFSVIDATESVEACEAQMAYELRYQSSHDLDKRTYTGVTQLPLAHIVVAESRKALVRRLDGYCLSHRSAYDAVLRFIQESVVPRLHRVAMSGFLELDSDSSPPAAAAGSATAGSAHPTCDTAASVFDAHAVAVDAFIDILTDRGFAVSHRRRPRVEPVSVDLASGAIRTATHWVHVFRITFPGGTVRAVHKAHSRSAALAGADAEAQQAEGTVYEEQEDDEALEVPVSATRRAQNAALG